MGSTARGLKVNNPGNIRKSGEVFKGEKLPSPDTAFKAFNTQAYGYRALAIILYNYYNKYGLNTIRKMITRYAPPSDGNDTNSYINLVASRVGVSPDRVITLADFSYPPSKPFMLYVIEAMAKIETAADANQVESKKGYDMFIADRL